MRIVLLSRGGDVRRLYEEAFSRSGVVVDCVDSFSDLLRGMAATPFNGIAIDLPLKFKIPKDLKQQEQEICSQFPTIQLNCDCGTGAIRALYQGQIKGGASLEEFIAQEISAFPARRIRFHPRRRIHFNVLIAGKHRAGKERKAVTMDVSLGGCFLYSVEDWNIHDRCRLRFLELGDNGEMAAEVKRIATWGVAMRVPGIGLSFQSLSEEQKKKLETLL